MTGFQWRRLSELSPLALSCTLAFVASEARGDSGSRSFYTWVGRAGGDWTMPENWFPFGVPDNSRREHCSARIDNNSDDTNVSLTDVVSIDSLVLDAGDTLAIASLGRLGIVGGGCEVNGLISVASTHSISGVFFTADTWIAGSGTIALSGTFAQLAGSEAALVTIGPALSVRGSGSVGAGSVRIDNLGLIEATEPGRLTVHALDALRNSGTIRAARGGELRLLGGDIDNTGGTIEAIDGGLLRSRATFSISGGTLSSTTDSTIDIRLGDVTLEGVAAHGSFEVREFGGLVLDEGTTLEGTVLVDGTAGNADLLIAADTTMLPSLAITLASGPSSNVLSSPAGHRMHLGADSSMRGHGDVGQNTLLLENDGLIQAEGGTMMMDLAPGENRNRGVLRAENGTLAILASVIDNRGGSMIAAEGGAIRLLPSSAILGGSLHGNGGVIEFAGAGAQFIDGSLLGSISILPNGDLIASGTMTNDGTLTINGGALVAELLVPPTGATIDGHGVIQLNGSNARIQSLSSNASLTIGPGQVVRGNGNVGGNSLSVVLQGSILADTGTLVIQPGSPGFFNEGLVRTMPGGGISAPSNSFTSTGEIVIEAGSTLKRGGTLLQTAGSITVLGTLDFFNPGTATLLLQGGSLSGNGTVTGHVTLGAAAEIAPSGSWREPSSIGSLTFAQSYTQNGALRLDIAGRTAESWDRIAIAGNATLGGVLRIDLGSDFEPRVGESFELVSIAGTRLGQFAAVESCGASFDLVYEPHAVRVIYAGRTGNGDADLDGSGTVGPADLAILLGAWGKCSHLCCLGDLDGDGAVGAADLALLLGAWSS